MDWEKACTFYRDSLIQCVWEAWIGYTRALRRAQYMYDRRCTKLAVSHYRHTLLKAVWLNFLKYRRALRAKARAVYSHCVCHGSRRTAFRAWRISLEKRRREITHTLVRHSKVSRRTVLFNFFRMWKDYMQAAALEKEIDNRVDMTWVRVQEWLK